MTTPSHTFYEFFAGGGMARAGLGSRWECLFANDFSSKKAESYIANWGAQDLVVEDVNRLTTKNLPGTADLIWGSFPCHDLSLAGAGAGLDGERSGQIKGVRLNFSRTLAFKAIFSHLCLKTLLNKRVFPKRTAQNADRTYSI